MNSSGSGGDGDGDGDGDGPDLSNCPEARDEENLDCPEFVEPIEGCYAQKGTCCYRKDHVTPEGATDASAISYRLNYSQVMNHTNTLGLDAINAAGVTRAEHEERTLLWRFTGPTDADGVSILSRRHRDRSGHLQLRRHLQLLR